MTADRPTLRPADVALLAACCAVLFAFPLLHGRTLSTHETVHCQNAREMRADGDLVIPHYGGRVWLERPPLPFWLTLPLLEALGDRPATYRLASVLMGLLCVLLVARTAAMWYGRATGILAGVALATLRQFNHYAAAPEADIFVCAVVTAGVALFAQLHFRCPPPGQGERRGVNPPVGGAEQNSLSPAGLCPAARPTEAWLIGRRPWALLALFVVLGLGNLVKGLFFADAFMLLPVAAFLLWGDSPLSQVRRYVWLPGWLAFALVGSAWAVAVYLRYPDVVELWFSDYGGRMNSGYMREPAWYYFANLPLMLFPWTPLAVAGLWLTRKEALTQGRTPERFLWCWALVPLLAFSVPSGKHQHYMLNAVAPWAILAAVAAVRLARRFTVPVSHPRVAFVSLLAALCLTCWAMHAQPRFPHDRYADDRAFVRRVRDAAPDAVYVLDDWGPLDASWLLFYTGERARLLHNASFLRDERLGAEIHVIARRRARPHLDAAGECELLFESACSRGEPSPEYRLGLYRLRLSEGPRWRGDVRISPMQATGRAPGPVLGISAQPPSQSSSSPSPGLNITGR